MNVPVAPSLRHATVRTLMLCFAVATVAAAALAWNGAPSPKRRYRQNEIARFSPTVGHGLVQLFGETSLVVVAAWIARRGLNVRL